MTPKPLIPRSSRILPYQETILNMDTPVRLCSGHRYAGKTWAAEMAIQGLKPTALIVDEIPVTPFTKDPNPGSFNKGVSQWTRLARSVFGVRGNSHQRRKRVRELQRMAEEFRRRHGRLGGGL